MAKRVGQLSLSKFADLYAEKLAVADFFVTTEKQILSLSEFPYRSDGYIVGVCTRGTAQLEVNLISYDVKPGVMLLATPFHVLRIYKSSTDFLCRFIVFSKSFLIDNNINSHFLESFSYFKSASIPVINMDSDSPDAKVILDMFLLIQQKLGCKEHPYRVEISRNIFTTLLYEIQCIYEKQNQIIKSKQNRKQKLNILFQELVFLHYKNHRNVQYYADELYLSPKHLTETIKEVTGRTAGEWIDDAVILEVKVLLRNLEISVARVADLFHFPDQSTFGKFFKKQTGISPTDYRTLSAN